MLSLLVFLDSNKFPIHEVSEIRDAEREKAQYSMLSSGSI